MSWIKMRSDLLSDPAVLRLRRITGLSTFDIVGRLYCLWSWADMNTVDGELPRVTAEDVANIVGDVQFVGALIQIKWLVKTRWGISIPNFFRHNGESAKARALNNQRQARWRDKKRVDVLPSTTASTRGEERREDYKTHGVPTPTVTRARATIPKPENPLGDISPFNGKTGAWWHTNDGIARKARELREQPRAGESFLDLKRRLFDVIAERERKAAS